MLEPMYEMERILGDAASLLSDEDIMAALAAATSDDGTVDPWLAAAEAVDLLGIRSLGTSGITRWTSEGASFERASADWFGMRDALRAKAGKNTGLTVISVEGVGDGGVDTGTVGPGYLTWDGDVPVAHPWRTPWY